MIKLNACPCCGAKTIAEVGEYEICDVCDWEDDPMQRENPDDALGANTMSLNQYRAEWKKKSARASVSA
jgi:hypothetical protein